MSVLFFFVIALLSEVIGTVAGFGSSVFFVPLAGLFLDFHSASCSRAFSMYLATPRN
jgi:uncharacterized membrane protein YfcA